MNPTSQHQDVFISFVERGKLSSTGLSQSLGLKSKTLDRFYCDKCRFSSRNHIQFQKHVSQHAEMTFSCSYCSHVSYTKGESQRHLVQHTGTFPFKCKFCEYGAIRNDYIVKHTERVHRVTAEKVNKKQCTLKHRFPISSGLCSSLTPTPETKVVSAPPSGNSNKVLTKEKTNNFTGLAKVQVELLAPLNEPIQHDRPLTVTYPPELSIPPGCFLELVEVKTINGTKELELKLVSQQSTEGDSPEKNLAGRTGEVVSQNRLSNIAKPSFHCSLVSQYDKTMASSLPVSEQGEQQQCGFSALKNLLAVHPSGNTNAINSSKQTVVTFKEEPEEREIELGDKIHPVISTSNDQMLKGKKPELDRKLVSTMKLMDPAVDSQAEIPPECVTQQNPSSSQPLEPSVVREYVSSSCERQITTSCTRTQTTSNVTYSSEDLSLVKLENCIQPVVRLTPEKTEGKVHATDLRSGDLPIISSVFSLHRESEDLTVSVGWEPNKKMEHDSVSVPLSVENQNASGSELPAVQELEFPQSPLCAGTASLVSSSCGDVQGRRPLSSQKTTVSEQSESMSHNNENHTNTTTIVNISKSQEKTENSQPAFIPEGTMLRISSTKCQSKSVTTMSTENSANSENWVPRTVLSRDASEKTISSTNLSPQCKGLKLSLKRRRSGAENEGLGGQWVQLDSPSGEEPGHSCKQSKHKKKKNKKMKFFLQNAGVSRGDLSKQWLIPLKEDQPITFPAPNQPVVILNHPRPRALREASNIHTTRLRKHLWPTCSQATEQMPCEPVQRHCLLKMKLKKVNQKKYQVVGFIYRDSPTRTPNC